MYGYALDSRAPRSSIRALEDHAHQKRFAFRFQKLLGMKTNCEKGESDEKAEELSLLHDGFSFFRQASAVRPTRKKIPMFPRTQDRTKVGGVNDWGGRDPAH